MLRCWTSGVRVALPIAASSFAHRRIHAAKNRLRLPLCVARSNSTEFKPTTKLQVSEPTKTVSLAVNQESTWTQPCYPGFKLDKEANRPG